MNNETVVREEKAESIFSKDEFLCSMKTEAEFKETLNQLMAVQVWMENPIDECVLDLLPEAPLRIDTDLLPQLKHVENKTPARILETMRGSGLIVKTRNIGDFMLRRSAYESLIQRAGLAGQTIARLYNERRQTFQEFINTGLSLYGGATKILVRDGRIAAMLSKDYAPMNQKILFERSLEILKERFDETEFREGFIAESVTAISVKLNSQTPLRADITRLLDRFGAKTVEMTVCICTSDIGQSHARIVPILMTDTGIPLGYGKKAEVRHSGRNTNEETFLENVGQVFPLYDEIAEQLEKREKENFYYPISVIESVSDKKVSTKIASLAAKRLFEEVGNGPCDGIEIYIAICDMINIAQEEGEIKDGMAKMALEEAIGRMLLMDWKKYDAPNIKRIKQDAQTSMI